MHGYIQEYKHSPENECCFIERLPTKYTKQPAIDVVKSAFVSFACFVGALHRDK